MRRVIAALEARVAHRQGDNWTCTAHADRTPSLTVREGEQGALVACRAGCTTADVAAALGLSLADLFDEPRHKGNGRREVEAYGYVDEREPVEHAAHAPDAQAPSGVRWRTSFGSKRTTSKRARP